MIMSPEAAQDTRIRQLEKSLRLTQWGCLGLLALLVAMGLVWYGVGGIPQKLIVVKRIAVVDDSGAMRIRIGEDAKTTARSARAAGVVLYDGNGHERGGMATMSNGSVALGLDAPNVPAGRSSDRVGMMVDGKGHVTFAVVDNHGMPVVMAKSSDHGGALQVMAPTEDGKRIQVRTLGATGDTQSALGGG